MLMWVDWDSVEATSTPPTVTVFRVILPLTEVRSIGKITRHILHE